MENSFSRAVHWRFYDKIIITWENFIIIRIYNIDSYFVFFALAAAKYNMNQLLHNFTAGIELERAK